MKIRVKYNTENEKAATKLHLSYAYSLFQW
jgi:hypothetical protein